jgi:antitoxin (DNA-binding transcriptional repressor) of toxin-antitoxin stability system
MNAAEFRQRCLAMLEHLPAEGLLITKRGRPVARILPVRTQNTSLIGSIADLVVDEDDNLFSTGAKWDAES